MDAVVTVVWGPFLFTLAMTQAAVLKRSCVATQSSMVYALANSEANAMLWLDLKQVEMWQFIAYLNLWI